MYSLFVYSMPRTWHSQVHKDESDTGQSVKLGRGVTHPQLFSSGWYQGRPVDLAPFELTPEGEAGFGPAEMGKTEPPGRGGDQGKMSGLTCLTVREDSDTQRENSLEGPGRGTKAAVKVDLHSLVSEDSQRSLDGGGKWLREMKLTKYHMVDEWEERGVVRIQSD